MIVIKVMKEMIKLCSHNALYISSVYIQLDIFCTLWTSILLSGIKQWKSWRILKLLKLTILMLLSHKFKSFTDPIWISHMDELVWIISVNFNQEQFRPKCIHIRGFPNSSADKESASNAGDTGDTGSISGSGRSPERGNGNLLQYPYLKNLTDGGTWQDTVQLTGHKELDTTNHCRW